MNENVLYYGDNLDILQRYIKDETIDLIYLDPPFKSEQDYNVLFAEQNGSRSAAQIHAFEDTWRWDTERIFRLKGNAIFNDAKCYSAKLASTLRS